LKKLFRSSLDEEVTVVTSSLPGLGKTETISGMAFAKGKLYVRKMELERRGEEEGERNWLTLFLN
jgi:hypothetical protein